MSLMSSGDAFSFYMGSGKLTLSTCVTEYVCAQTFNNHCASMATHPLSCLLLPFSWTSEIMKNNYYPVLNGFSQAR